MAGLLGAMIAGGVGGAAKQNVKDLEEKERFDYQQALQDAEFTRRVFMQNNGFAQEKEMQGIRKQDAREQSDYEFGKKVEGVKTEIDLKDQSAQKERERKAGYFDEENPISGSMANSAKAGDLDTTKDYASLQKSSDIYDYKSINGELVRINKKTNEVTKVYDGDEDNQNAKAIGKGSSKGKGEKDWNKEMLPVLKEVKETVLTYPNMTTQDDFGKATPTKEGRAAQAYAERILKANPDFTTSNVADIAHEAATNPKALGFKQFKQSDGSIIKVPAISYKGEVYEYSNAAMNVIAAPKKQEPAPRNKIAPKHKLGESDYKNGASGSF